LRTTRPGVWARTKGPNFPNFKRRRPLRQEKFGPLLTRRCGPNPNQSDPRRQFHPPAKWGLPRSRTCVFPGDFATVRQLQLAGIRIKL